MKIIGRLLLVTMTLHLLAPIPVLAQQTAAQLREQIAKLEKIDLDPETSPDVSRLNREFLRERQMQLGALVRRRVAALRQYLVTMGDALSSGERQAVEESIRTLNAELQRAAPPAESASAPAAQHRAESAASKPDETGRAAFSGSLIPAGAYLPEPRNYLNASAASPDSPGQEEASRDRNGKEKRIEVDTRTIEQPEAVEVPNGTIVTFIMKRSPVNTCKADLGEGEKVSDGPNPLAQFLKVLTGFGVIPLFSKTNSDRTPERKEICKPIEPGVPVPPVPEAIRIEVELKDLRDNLEAKAGDLEGSRQQYESLGTEIKDFTGCKNGICVSDTDAEGREVVSKAFKDAKDTLQKDVGGQLASELPSIESAELQMGALKKAIAEGYKKTGAPGESDWVQSVTRRLDCLAQNLDALRKRRESLAKARAELETVRDLLAEFEPAVVDEQTFTYRNTKFPKGKIICTNYFTKQVVKQVALSPGKAGGPKSVTREQIPVEVTYQNPQKGVVTAGLIYSTLGKRQLGVLPVLSGKTPEGADTFTLKFAETDTAKGQLIPFTFYNHSLWRPGKFTVNASAGVGVNPNNGSNQVEFFFGGSVGYKNVFFELGSHVGRWQELGGGFVIGDAVSTAPSSVPIERRYTMRPAFGVSYKIPLP